MYITINGMIGEKRIDLSYPIKGKEAPAEAAVVSVLSNNVQYWLQGSIEVLLKMCEKIVLNKGVLTDKELNAIIGQELKSQMDDRNDVLRTNKLEKVMKMAISMDELDNSDNLEDGRPSNTIPITSKMVDPATPYLRIMLLVLNILRVSNQPRFNVRNSKMVRSFLCPWK